MVPGFAEATQRNAQQLAAPPTEKGALTLVGSLFTAAVALPSLPQYNSATTQVFYVFQDSANAGNGMSIRLDFGTGLNGTGKQVTISDIDLCADSVLNPPEIGPFHLDQLWCQRYLPSFFNGGGGSTPYFAAGGTADAANTGNVSVDRDCVRDGSDRFAGVERSGWHPAARLLARRRLSDLAPCAPRAGGARSAVARERAMTEFSMLKSGPASAAACPRGNPKGQRGRTLSLSFTRRTTRGKGKASMATDTLDPFAFAGDDIALIEAERRLQAIVARYEDPAHGDDEGPALSEAEYEGDRVHQQHRAHYVGRRGN